MYFSLRNTRLIASDKLVIINITFMKKKFGPVQKRKLEARQFQELQRKEQQAAKALKKAKA